MARRASPEGLLRVKPGEAAEAVAQACAGLPALEGKPVHVVFRPALWARGGRLLGRPPGVEVHAASLLRRRRICLEEDLLGDPSELRRILIHEIFHFVWLRLGNGRRRQWEMLLAAELCGRARGELGHSSEWRKQALKPAGIRTRSRRWREYVCESFCDSAAWYFLRPASHPEFTLEKEYRRRRERWFSQLLACAPLPV